MSEDIKPQEEAIEITDLSDGKKFLVGGGGTLAGILIDAGMMHHSGVGGLIFGTIAGAVTAFGYPVIRPMVDSVCHEFNTLVGKRQALIAARLEQSHEVDFDGSISPSPATTNILETTTQEAAQMQLGPDQQVIPEGVDRTLVIPHAPKFKEMSHLIGSDRLILCYTVDGPLYGTVIDLLSMAIVGKPGRGKTTALMYYVSMLLKNGAEVFIWDPHGTMGELALLNGKTLSGMPATAKVVYLDRKDDMVASVPVLQQKLQERDDEYRQCVRAGKPFVKHPLLLLSDELPVLADYDEQVEAQYKKINRERKTDGEDELEVPSLITLIRRFVLEARKWLCYFIGSGQSTDAQILPTRVTENLSSRIVFYSSDRRARMAGLEQEDVKKFLPILKRADPGTMVFDGSRFDAPMLGAIPEINAADMKAFLLGDAVQAQLAPQDGSREATLGRIIALFEAGNISEKMMWELVGRLPVAHDDGLLEQELATGDLAPEIIDFQARNARRVDPTPVHVEQQSPVANAARSTKSLSPELQRAFDAYREGYTSSRTLAPKLDIGKTKAAELLQELKRRKLVS
jgi:hypothetical protein